MTDTPAPKETISAQEAHQLVDSLPARMSRFGYVGHHVSQQFNIISMGTVAIGAALTYAAFSKSLPYRWRMVSGVGAIMSAGAATLMAVSSAVSQQMAPTLDNEIQPLVRAMCDDPKIRQALVEYMQKNISREELAASNGDLTILEKFFRFAEEKQLIRRKATVSEEQGQSWEERYNTGAGKQVFLSASYN